MANSSNLATLAETLKQKQAEDRQQIEALTKAELETLAESLRQQSSAALNTTLDAIESSLNQRLKLISQQIEAQTKPMTSSLASVKAEAQQLQALTIRAWLKPLALSLSLLLGIFGASWGLTAWLSSSIKSQLQTRAELSQQIEQQRQTLARLESRTWGVDLYQDSGGKYLVLPPGVEPGTGYKNGARHAVRLGKN